MTAPHSPVLPHTPLPAPIPSQRTPYTPFSAFAAKQNPFEIGFASSAHAHLLDDSEDSLAGLFNTILKWVERDLKRVMEVAERCCAKGTGKGNGLLVMKEKEKGERFEIMANVVWAEVGKAIVDELGSVVFAAGKPDEFRKVCFCSPFLLYCCENTCSSRIIWTAP